jgi:hypothetical protein
VSRSAARTATASSSAAAQVLRTVSGEGGAGKSATSTPIRSPQTVSGTYRRTPGVSGTSSTNGSWLPKQRAAAVRSASSPAVGSSGRSTGHSPVIR